MAGVIVEVNCATPETPFVSTSDPANGANAAGESGAFCWLYRPKKECFSLISQSPRRLNWSSSSRCTGVPIRLAPFTVGALVTGIYGRKFLETALIRLAGIRLPGNGCRVFV